MVDAPTVVVVAPDGTTADVLASALTVLSLDDARLLIGQLPGVAARWSGPGAAGSRWQTPGFPLPAPPP